MVRALLGAGRRRSVSVMDTVKVYGAGWCEDTQETRDYLDGSA